MYVTSKSPSNSARADDLGTDSHNSHHPWAWIESALNPRYPDRTKEFLYELNSRTKQLILTLQQRQKGAVGCFDWVKPA